MRHVLAAAAIGVVLGAGVQAQQKPGEWVSLFDGKDISTHWRGFKQKGMPAGWEIVDGTITWTGAGRPTGRPVDSDLVSVEQYANFELEWEWKLPPGGNSGIMFRVSEDQEATYHSGPEYQLLDNARHQQRSRERFPAPRVPRRIRPFVKVLALRRCDLMLFPKNSTPSK